MNKATRWICGSMAAVCALAARPVLADEADAADLSLEDLLKTEVVTASRRAQTVQSTTAAAFVITREDIERSGATSIPEALRMAPGVQVARLASNRWAVSVRGFNGRFANKLLVLLDGRSIYSPLFSGVMWEAEDTLLEDVERIEVIRGPGAAMWGANAVNGVINIITRKARDTQDGLFVASAGNEERAALAVRQGGQVADGHFRLWAKARQRDDSITPDGRTGNDHEDSQRLGFRGDWRQSADHSLTVSGAVYSAVTGDRWNTPSTVVPQGFVRTDVRQKNQGVHLLGREEWVLADGSEAALQAFLDHSDDNTQTAFHERRSTVDLDFQHRIHFGSTNDVVWGLNYRYSRDRIATQGIFGINPGTASQTLFSAFLHDEIAVVPDRLHLTLGARIEHFSYTGWEPQPNARLLWTLTPAQSVWGAVSRAVRTPSRSELDATMDTSVRGPSPSTMNLPVLVRVVPNATHSLLAEQLTAYELGYRHQFGSTLSLDLAAFSNQYDDLRSTGLGNVVLSPVPPYIVQNIVPNNAVTSRAQGVELALDWRPRPWLRVQPSYSYLRVHSGAVNADPINLMYASVIDGSAPRNQLSLRTAFTLSESRQLDLWLRYTGALGEAYGGITTATPRAYTALDARYAWRPVPALELSVVLQNLLHASHLEFIPDRLPSEALEVQRGAFVKARLSF